MSFRLKKGDTVQIIAGDNKGQNGKILKVNVDKNTVLVEGSNLVKRHTKPNRNNQQGGILEKESSIHISNVMSATNFDARAAKRTPAAATA